MKILTNLFLFLLISSYSAHSQAQLTVVDPTAIAQLIKEVDYLKMEMESLKNFNWSTQNAGSQQALIQLSNYIEQTGNIASNAQSVSRAFEKDFPGYKAPDNYNTQYQNIINDTQTSLSSVMKGMAYLNSNNDVQNENNQLNAIQNQIAHSQGTTQAIEGMSQITAQTVTQLQLLRQTIAAQSAAQDAYNAAQLQKEASAKAEINQIISNGDTKIIPLNSNPIKKAFN